MNHKPYQAFFKKRLQTESFLDTQMSTTNMSELTTKIIRSLKKANQQSSKNRQKMQMAKSRIATKENQQAEQRQQLRQKLNSRMRISQTNLERINSQRKKALSSRSQFQQKTKKKIKESQKRQLEDSLVHMHKTQKQAEKFFRETQQKKLNEFKRLQKIQRSDRTRYGSLNQTNYANSYFYDTQDALNNSRSNSSAQVKPQKKVLKVSETQIYEKQKKKQSIQVEKQTRYLSQYVAKMQNILNVRKKGAKIGKQPVATFPKVISQQRQTKSRKRISISPNKLNSSNATKQPSKRVSFSELYMQKLNQKRGKKEVFHSLVLQQGDDILEKQQEKTKVLRQSKIIKQSLNQYRRWSNMVANYKLQK